MKTRNRSRTFPVILTSPIYLNARWWFCDYVQDLLVIPAVRKINSHQLWAGNDHHGLFVRRQHLDLKAPPLDIR